MQWWFRLTLMGWAFVGGDNLAGKPGLGYIVQVLVGTPPQTFNVLVDTGSTNFAIAGGPHDNIHKYFYKNVSSTFKDLEENVSLSYTQGTWMGKLANDVIKFPMLNSVPNVTCDIALITQSHDIFMNGSDWQGILGLAYPAIARPTSNVKSWIDFLQKKNKDKTIAFSLTLCGPQKVGQNSHVGSFEILNNMLVPYKDIQTAMVVREWYYEIILTGLFVDGILVPVECRSLNIEQTIVDSGTTNIRLPRDVFMELVKLLIFSVSYVNLENDSMRKNISEKLQVKYKALKENFSKEFWLEQESACWETPQLWEYMPVINIEIASGTDTSFRINLPASSYIRMDYENSQEGKYCYKFSVEPSDMGTILGVIALEGFQVIFNRTARTVGFIKSDCGPNVSLEGPFLMFDKQDLIEKCLHKKIVSNTSLLNIAGYIVCIALFFASCMFIYFIVQWVKNKYFKYCAPGTMVSMSHMSLINDEF